MKLLTTDARVVLRPATSPRESKPPLMYEEAGDCLGPIGAKLGPEVSLDPTAFLADLEREGLVDSAPRPTAFTRALDFPELKAQTGLSLKLATALEKIIQGKISQKIHFYQICVILKRELQCSDEDLAGRITAATGVIRARRTISKNIQAGRFLSRRPDMVDITDTHILLLLSRVPDQPRYSVLSREGTIRGKSVRMLSRQELKEFLRASFPEIFCKPKVASLKRVEKRIRSFADSLLEIAHDIDSRSAQDEKLKKILFQFCERVDEMDFDLRALEKLLQGTQESSDRNEREETCAA